MADNKETNEATEEKEKITYTDVLCVIEPDWEGPRVETRATIDSPGFYKLLYKLPAPELNVTEEIDAECNRLYGKSAQALLGLGIVNNTYACKGQIKDHYAGLTEDNDLPQVLEKNGPTPIEVFHKIERETKTSETKKVKSTMAEYNVTSSDKLAEELAELKRLRAEKAEIEGKGKKGKKSTK